MRKVLLSIAAAGSALALASPASAQVYGNIGIGLGTPSYGAPAYGYGYNNYGQVRYLQARIDNVQRQLRWLDRGHGGWDHGNRDGRFERLRDEARNIERRLQRTSRYGLNPYEANDIQARVARLEQRVNYAMAGGYGRGGYGNGYGNSDHGYGGYGYSNRGDGDHDRDYGHDRDQDDDD